MFKTVSEIATRISLSTSPVEKLPCFLQHLIPLQRGVDDPRGPAREAQPKNTLRSAKSYTQRKAQDIKDLESSTSQGHSTLASVKTAPAQMGGPPPRDNGLHRSSVTGTDLVLANLMLT